MRSENITIEGKKEFKGTKDHVILKLTLSLFVPHFHWEEGKEICILWNSNIRC